MNDQTLGDILDIAKATIQQVSRLPRAVETTAKGIENTFTTTAEALDSTASKLELRAQSLRQKAEWLRSQASLADELRQAISFEQTAFEEVKSLALIDVGIRNID